MKIFTLTASYLIASAEIILALYFFSTSSKNTIRRVTGFLTLVTGLWVLTTTMAAYNASPWAFHLYQAAHIFGLLIVTILFHFALVFPTPKLRLDSLHLALLFIPTVILSLILIGSRVLLTSFTASATEAGVWYGGGMYWLYTTYLLVMYTVSIVFMMIRSRSLDGILRKNLRIVILSIVLGGFPAIVTDVIMPLFLNYGQYALIGGFSSLAWLGITMYVVLRK